jgi:DNA polymerase-1
MDLYQSFCFEMQLPAVLAHMEYEGVGFSPQKLETYRDALQQRMNILTSIAEKMVGKINLSSVPQVRKAIYEVLGLKFPSVIPNSVGATSERVLNVLSSEHKFPKIVTLYRHCEKLLSEYISGLIGKGELENDVFSIHTCWTHTSTGTGRLSSVDPNLQNIPRGIQELPVIDEAPALTLNVRDAFIARSGMTFVCADYSQSKLLLFFYFLFKIFLLFYFLFYSQLNCEF